MKRVFLRPLSLILTIAMLLSLTCVAEDGSTIAIDDDYLETNDAASDDELISLEIEATPEDLPEMDLLGDVLLDDDQGEILAPEDQAAPVQEESGAPVEATGVSKNTSVPKKLTLGKGETYDFGMSLMITSITGYPG